MTSKLRLTGMPGLRGGFHNLIKRSKLRIQDVRKKIAISIVDGMIENMPVWSGRAVSSIQVGNSSGGGKNAPHPDRGGTALDGEYLVHPEWGITSKMSLGEEPMRPAAEATARASAEGADYSMDKDVFITSHQYHVGLVEQAKAPKRGAGRNIAVVSAIAVAKVKSIFAGVVK